MTYFIAKIKDLFFKRPHSNNDPVFEFFFKTSAGERKKVYTRALNKAQIEQEKVQESALAKNRA